MKGAYLGPQFSNNEIKLFLDQKGYKYQELEDNELPEKIADLVADQK